MKPIKLSKLIISILIPLATGGLASLISGGYSTYKEVVQPPASPPSIVFPIVWTVLYILMGISAYIINDGKNRNKKQDFMAYYVQLALNFLWPIVFFGFENFTFAAVVLVALIIAIIVTIVRFSKFSKPAAYLLIPYLVWCCFALYLNIGVAVLN